MAEIIKLSVNRANTLVKSPTPRHYASCRTIRHTAYQASLPTGKNAITIEAVADADEPWLLNSDCGAQYYTLFRLRDEIHAKYILTY